MSFLSSNRRRETPAVPQRAEPEAEPTLVPVDRDPDLGVPPFRTAAKEPPVVPAPPKPSASPLAGPVTARPVAPGTAIPAAPRAAARPDPADRRTLVVGKGISLQGTVTDAERLVVEGTVESEMMIAAELNIAHNGVFKGAVEVEDAEIAGTFDGTLTATNSLIVRATGRVIGTANCRRLSVEEGGQLEGSVRMDPNLAQRPLPAPPPPVLPAPSAYPARYTEPADA